MVWMHATQSGHVGAAAEAETGAGASPVTGTSGRTKAGAGHHAAAAGAGAGVGAEAAAGAAAAAVGDTIPLGGGDMTAMIPARVHLRLTNPTTPMVGVLALVNARPVSAARHRLCSLPHTTTTPAMLRQQHRRAASLVPGWCSSGSLSSATPPGTQLATRAAC